MSTAANFTKKVVQTPELAQIVFDASVLDKYLAQNGTKVTRTRTVGRVKTATWSVDFGIAPDDRTIHLTLSQIINKLPESEHAHWFSQAGCDTILGKLPQNAKFPRLHRRRKFARLGRTRSRVVLLRSGVSTVFMLRRFFWLLPFLLLHGVARAQPLPDHRPLVGMAVDAGGKPLAGALISVRRDLDDGATTFWGASTASDARGAFGFPAAEIGRYFLNAELPGYAPISNQWVIWTATAVPLRLRFERLVTLSLQMTRADGSPATNSAFWVRLRGDSNAGQSTRRASSDAQGRLSISDLLPANYAVFAASADGFALQQNLALRGDATQALTLQKGGRLNITTQENATAKPLGGAQLTLVPENAAEALRLSGDAANVEENFGLLAARGDWLTIVARDGDGRLSLENVPPGRYRARIMLAGYQPGQTQVVQIEAGQSSDIVWNLVPQPNRLRFLTLQLHGGRVNRVVAGEYLLRLLPIGENGALEPEQGTPFQPGGNPGRRAIADASGKITLFPLVPGRYRIFVAPRTPGHELEDGAAEAAALDVSVPLQGVTASLTLK